MRRISSAAALLLGMTLLTNCTAGGSPGPTTTTAPPTSSPAPTLPPSPTPLPEGQEAILDVSLDEAISLAGEWRYRQVGLFTEDMAQPGYDDSQWAEVEAPATWAAQGLAELTAEAAVAVYRR